MKPKSNIIGKAMTGFQLHILVPLTVLFSLNFDTSFGQTNIGIGTNSPDSSALLDIYALDKGVLLPRLTRSQRNAISNPAAGLIIFNTDENCFEFFTGTSWKLMCNYWHETENHCPFGFIAVKERYCIEFNPRSPANWFDAVKDCMADGYRLCSWEEWFGACKQMEDGTIASMHQRLTNAEWSSTGGGSASIKRPGAGSCENVGTQNPVNLSSYRCCVDRFETKRTLLNVNQPTDTGLINLALNQPATASNYTSFLPGFAVDGIISTLWHSNNFAPQWIRVELDTPNIIHKIRWYPAQVPPGDVTITFSGTRDGSNYIPIQRIDQFQDPQQWYEIQLLPGMESLLGIEMRTDSSQSHIGIWELEVLGRN